MEALQGDILYYKYLTHIIICYVAVKVIGIMDANLMYLPPNQGATNKIKCNEK